MNESKRMRVKLAMAGVLILAPVMAWAGVNMDAYPQFPGNATVAASTLPSEQITGATLTDALTFDTPIANRRQIAAGHTTVCVEADLSGAAADTVVVWFIPYHVSTDGLTVTRMAGAQNVTATAGTPTDAAGDNIAPAIFFEIPSGCTHYEIRHEAPSSGNVDLFWVAYSADPE